MKIEDLDTIVYVRLLTCHIKFRKSKELKKELSEKLMSLA